MYRYTIALFIFLLLVSQVKADPCGMVTSGPGIFRTGVQRTYVFYKDGIQSIVLRPGFTGSLDNFGMLIPFPTPPAIRKVEDNIFAHIAAAIDPPEFQLFPRERYGRQYYPFTFSSLGTNVMIFFSVIMEKARSNRVRVLSEEGIGMYQVAVLEAGSASALKKWMTNNNYQYPQGMDTVCNEYIDMGWCFVVVKARIGGSSGINPTPGMNNAQLNLRKGQFFSGFMQGMAFRFRSKEMIVPMRLSVYNTDFDATNTIYALTDEPVRVDCLDTQYVVRQIPGEVLLQNFSGPVPLRVYGKHIFDCRLNQYARWKSSQAITTNKIARKLFAHDALAAKRDVMILVSEQDEKDQQKKQIDYTEPDNANQIDEGLQYIKDMTLSVISGIFPSRTLADKNLRFTSFSMPERENNTGNFHAMLDRPGPRRGHVYQSFFVECGYLLIDIFSVFLLISWGLILAFAPNMRFAFIAMGMVIISRTATVFISVGIVPILILAIIVARVINVTNNKKKTKEYYSSRAAAVFLGCMCWLDVIVGSVLIVRNRLKYNSLSKKA
ncbi:DUF2330 domain-containing protein [Candidatus Uabimicrobium amorphum]|uniref:Uncharacterized protein n=1 Tax=Uabimicrobium amorphum TaxID=2596890 RepID=A0A5S9F101_UABAM|nr:DUF2330 domain-containing protein [Candidatus Uabimicrobium amorphum]BBM82145.1 hypothetical protein UABAM_00488 [Candidatus Uabimicrobium amorphum]